MARWSSTGRSRVAMTTLTLGRALSMVVRPVRVAVPEAQRAGDEGDDLPVAARQLRPPGLVEPEIETTLVEPHGVAGHRVVDAEVGEVAHRIRAEEGEALGGHE